MVEDLWKYWDSIPVGRENALTYEQLEEMWGMSSRSVRRTLADLSRLDNGDNYILIRSSANKGFYLSDDPQDIAAYKKECRSRAVKTFAPLKKINRVLSDILPEEINYSFTNNLKLIRKQCGMTQASVCVRMQYYDKTFDASMLSKLEDGWAMPTPVQLSALAHIYGCAPFELVAVERDALDIYMQ